MSLDGLRVDHVALDTAAQDLRRTVTDIDDRLDRLARELAPLSTDWAGDAQRAYETARARWELAMREMRDLLDDTSRRVHQSNAEYRAADQRGARSFDG